MGTAYGRPTELAEAQVVAEKATAELEEIFRESMVLVGGSVRRLKPIVSDVDLLVVVQGTQQSLLDRLGFAPPSIDTHDGWHITPKTATREMDGVRVEAWWCPSTSVGPMLQFITGPGDLNVYLRRMAQKRGEKLSQYGLLRDGRRMDLETPIGSEVEAFEMERSFMALLGEPWMDPEERENWREHVRG